MAIWLHIGGRSVTRASSGRSRTRSTLAPHENRAAAPPAGLSRSSSTGFQHRLALQRPQRRLRVGAVGQRGHGRKGHAARCGGHAARPPARCAGPPARAAAPAFWPRAPGPASAPRCWPMWPGHHHLRRARNGLHLHTGQASSSGVAAIASKLVAIALAGASAGVILYQIFAKQRQLDGGAIIDATSSASNPMCWISRSASACAALQKTPPRTHGHRRG
jgi:hypothetical protein